MHDVLKHGGLSSLPEEVQWQIRLLLPRQAEDGQGPVRDVPVQGPEAAHLGPQDTNASLETAPGQSGALFLKADLLTGRFVDIVSIAVFGQVKVPQIGVDIEEVIPESCSTANYIHTLDTPHLIAKHFHTLALEHVVTLDARRWRRSKNSGRQCKIATSCNTTHIPLSHTLKSGCPANTLPSKQHQSMYDTPSNGDRMLIQ